MKIGVIIQARHSSARMEGKVLLPLPFPSGPPMLKHIIDSIKQSTQINYICVATSKLLENNVIADFAASQDVDCYRGNEEDVLSRFIHVSVAKSLDVVVRLTGDNPLVDFKKLDQVILYHMKCGDDYTKTSGLPLGMNFEIINSKALVQLSEEPCTPEDKEHVTRYLNTHPQYRKSIFNFEYPALKDLRCTVDYPSDFAFMNIVLSLIRPPEDIIEQLIEIVHRHKWLADINSRNHQVKHYLDNNSELREAYHYLLEGGFPYSAKKLIGEP